MNRFRHGKIGDFLTLQRGFDITKKEQVNGQIPVISSSGIASYHNDYKVKGPGVVIGRKGTLGTVFYVKSNYWPHDTSLWVKDFKGNEPEFIYYFLKTLPLEKLDSGSANPTLNRNVVHLLDACIPILHDQRKIAAVLSALDAKIALNHRINGELEGMAKLLYDYWFVQYDFPLSAAQAAALGKPRLIGQPYRTSGGPMVYHEQLKREVPEGWEVKPLFEAMSVQYGFPFSTKQFTSEVTHVPVVRIRDILENTISLYTTERVDEKYKLAPNDLVIGMDGNFHMNFWDKEGSYLNQRSVRVRAKEKSAISSFQSYFELAPYIKAREKNVSRTTVGHLSDKDLKRLHLMEPETSNEFAPRATFDSFLSQILLNRTQNQELTTLRDWLLPMLMNGQVRVG